MFTWEFVRPNYKSDTDYETKGLELFQVPHVTNITILARNVAFRISSLGNSIPVVLCSGF